MITNHLPIFLYPKCARFYSQYTFRVDGNLTSRNLVHSTKIRKVVSITKKLQKVWKIAKNTLNLQNKYYENDI